MKVLEARLENLLKRKKALEIGFAQNTELNVAELEVNPVDEKFLNKVIGLITDNLSDSDYDINRLASDVNMSRSTLSRKMKAVTGQTVIDFIHNIKMKKACLMLNETNENIIAVSACLGYDDSRYFSSSFKNTFGITPLDFRKNNSIPIKSEERR